MRSILTMLGVIIGVASVIALLAIGNGFSENITSEITSIGTNLISISTDCDNSGGYPALSLDDVDALSDPANVPAADGRRRQRAGQPAGCLRRRVARTPR